MKTLECPHCTQNTQTSAPPGKQTKCRRCGTKFRVPLGGKRSKGAEFECPECGEITRSGASPGQKTTCRSCKAKIRVPLRDAPESDADESDADESDADESDAEAPSKPSVRRTCPACEEKVPGVRRFCPECGVDMAALLQEQRYGNLEHDTSTFFGMIASYGLPGGATTLVAGLGWLVMGLSEGYLYYGSLILSGFGIAIILGSLGSRH